MIEEMLSKNSTYTNTLIPKSKKTKKKVHAYEIPPSVGSGQVTGGLMNFSQGLRLSWSLRWIWSMRYFS
jgi:hypothetical protein